MTNGRRSVVVKQMPNDPRQWQSFLEEVTASMPQRRPCLVLDCSLLRKLDAGAMHLMLHCLEEALRRNGDARLGGLRPEALPVFEAAGMRRLFDLYGTTAEAVASFHQGFMASEPGTAAIAVLQAAPAT